MITVVNSISLGDLFTGLSVITTAAGITISQLYDRRKQRRVARAAGLEESLRSLTAALEEGLSLAERLKWQKLSIGGNKPATSNP